MKYKLLKDLPFAKAGEVFERVTYKSKDGEDEVLFTIDYNYFLDNFDEWFEKIEEPTTSVRRTPKMGEAYFYVDEYGNVEREIWDNDGVDNELMAMGFVRLTPEEATEARDRRLAKVRLEQTSNFEPDPNKGELGWVVGYSCRAKKLAVERLCIAIMAKLYTSKPQKTLKNQSKKTKPTG